MWKEMGMKILGSLFFLISLVGRQRQGHLHKPPAPR